MLLTVVYTVNGREHKHSGREGALTRFLKSLDSQGIAWRYDDVKATGSNAFASVVLASK